MFLKSTLIIHQNALKSSGKIVKHIKDEAENNGYDLSLSDFELKCSSDDCDDWSQVYRHKNHGNH